MFLLGFACFGHTRSLQHTIWKIRADLGSIWRYRNREKTQVKHKKIIGKNTIIIMALFGHCMVKLYLNNGFNGLIDCSRFGLVYTNPDFIILDIETWHFHDFWASVALEACIYVFYYTEMLKKYKNNMGTSWGNIIFANMDINKLKNAKIRAHCFRLNMFRACHFIL